jgi:hypothetical protein
MVKAAPGFGYGWVLAWAFVMSFTTFMVGLILEGFEDVVSTQLEKSERRGQGRAREKVDSRSGESSQEWQSRNGAVGARRSKSALSTRTCACSSHAR